MKLQSTVTVIASWRSKGRGFVGLVLVF